MQWYKLLVISVTKSFVKNLLNIPIMKLYSFWIHKKIWVPTVWNGVHTYKTSRVMRHKSGTENKVANALSNRSHLFTNISITVRSFKEIQKKYISWWSRIYRDLLNGEFTKHPKFSIHDDYLFHGNQLCSPATSIRKHVLLELHGGRCSGHLWRDNTLTFVNKHFFWPCLKTNVAKIWELCRVCQLAKG